MLLCIVKSHKIRKEFVRSPTSRPRPPLFHHCNLAPLFETMQHMDVEKRFKRLEVERCSSINNAGGLCAPKSTPLVHVDIMMPLRPNNHWN